LYNDQMEEEKVIPAFEPIYNRHYISIDAQNRIVDIWSDGPNPDRDTTEAICINDKGNYQFRLAYSISFAEGSPVFVSEENPQIFTDDGIPLYIWNGKVAVMRTEEEIAADRTAIPEPPPSEMERLRADLDFVAAMQGVIL